MLQKHTLGRRPLTLRGRGDGWLKAAPRMGLSRPIPKNGFNRGDVFFYPRNATPCTYIHIEIKIFNQINHIVKPKK